VQRFDAAFKEAAHTARGPGGCVCSFFHHGDAGHSPRHAPPNATPGETTTPDFSTIKVANCMLPTSRKALGRGAQANIEAAGGGISHPARPNDSIPTSASRRLR